MAPFIKLVGEIVGANYANHHGADRDEKVLYVRTDKIDHMCKREGYTRIYETITADEYNAKHASAPDDYRMTGSGDGATYYRYFPTVELIFEYDKTNATYFLTLGTPDELLARIAELEAPAPSPWIMKPRGEWRPGEDYARFDVVEHPDDAAKEYLCLAPNSSSSAGVLTNRKRWCLLTTPA